LTNLAAQYAAKAVLSYSTSDGGTVTFKDVSGLDESTVTTWVGTLTATTYDHIFLYCDFGIAGHGGTGKVSYDNLVSLYATLKAASQTRTVITSGTAQAGGNTTITLATTASASNDTYNKMVCYLTAGTGIGGIRWIVDYTGASKVADIDASKWATNPDGTTHYEVGYVTGMHQFFAVDTSGQNLAIRTWNIAYPDATMPKVIKYVGAGGFAVCSGTAQSYTSGTKEIVLPAAITTGDRATGHATNSYYVGKYVYVYSATTGEGQYETVATYTGSSKSAILTNAFTTNLTGTIIIRVMDDDTELFYDAYAKLFILTYLTSSTHADWQKLFDSNLMLENYIDRSPVQDQDLLDTYLAKGKALYEGIAAAVTAIPA
jgi:hypothetical protein